MLIRLCAGTVPCEGAQKYYKQRAVKGGLILTEATTVSATGHGCVHPCHLSSLSTLTRFVQSIQQTRHPACYVMTSVPSRYPNTPGIFRKDQVDAWKPIVSGVHEAGGVFFVQLWHVGRASHPGVSSNQPPDDLQEHLPRFGVARRDCSHSFRHAKRQGTQHAFALQTISLVVVSRCHALIFRSPRHSSASVLMAAWLRILYRGHSPRRKFCSWSRLLQTLLRTPSKQVRS